MTTDSWDRAAKHYGKKRQNEYAAVLRNLERYLSLLNSSKNNLCVQAGFIHNEPSGILALDQKGGGSSLQETRLYLYAEAETKTVHLITIGNKSDQPTDIASAKLFVEALKKKTEKEA